MYTIEAFAKNKNMKKLTKILLILFVLVTIPALVMGKSIFNGISPTDKGFSFNFDTQAIIAIVLAAISFALGTYLYIRFIISQPVDKAIFFSSLPLVVLYGFSLFMLAEISAFNNPLAVSIRNILNLSTENLYNTVLWAILLTLVFIGLLFLNCFVFCKPIAKVERIVSRLGDGKVKDENLKIGGVKQFNSIEHSLNKINNNYRSKDRSLKTINLEAQKFIPKQFFKFLGKSNIQELELGNQVKKVASSMLVKLIGLESKGNMTLEENFNFVNAYIHVISPLIRKFGGFIDKYNGEGVTAVFGQAEDAIDCSHAIIRAINVKNRQNKSLPNVEQRISIMTSEVIFGIVGEEEHKMPTIISNVTGVLEKLDEVCRIMNAKIVFTKSSLDSLPLNYKFLYRHIGKLSVNENKEVIIFEDFEILPKDISAQLIKSKAYFERGVILYEEGSIENALELFSQSLKICPRDKGCYIYYNRAKEKVEAQ